MLNLWRKYNKFIAWGLTLTIMLASLEVVSLFYPIPKIAQATITRIARGSNIEDNVADAGLIISGVAASTTGSSLIVSIGCFQNTVPSVSSVSWSNGGTFKKDTAVTNGSHRVEIWSAHNVPSGNNSMTIIWSAACNRKVGIVSELVSGNGGALASSTSATATGSTNPATTSSITCTPNSGATCAWISALEVGRNNTDAAPTWSVPTTAGQKNGTTGNYTAEAFEIDSAAVTQGASATMANETTYAMAMVSYTEPAAAAANNTPQLHQVIIIGQRLPIYDKRKRYL